MLWHDSDGRQIASYLGPFSQITLQEWCLEYGLWTNSFGLLQCNWDRGLLTLQL
jgi:hypothetical protein